MTRTAHRVYPRVPVLTSWPAPARIVERLLAPVRDPILWKIAFLRRRRLSGTTFIGIAGSAGKTMTKAMIGAVLKSRYEGVVRRGSSNFVADIADNILAVRAGDRFCAIELSADKGPGALCKPLALLRPEIGVITNIGTDHFSAYGSCDAIAEEKGRLVRELPAEGVAILNADDPRVLGMRASCRARVITYGEAEDADLRAEAVSSVWPDRLSFELVHEDKRARVQTQMCGTQWVSAALAGAAVGLAMDVPWNDIVRALGSVEPFVGRMSPMVLPDGVTFLRDDWKASLHTIPPALEFLRAAGAARKVAVLGTISDYGGDSRMPYVRAARHALEVADFVVFVGPHAPVALRAAPAGAPDRLRAFATARAATDFLSAFLQPGDLVLLKGSNTADHLVRIALSRTSPVTCWRSDCRKSAFCNSCSQVAKAPPPGDNPKRADDASPAEAARRAGDYGLVPGSNVVVGLGNPGDKYANTPHNVGYAVLEQIAAETDAAWSELARVLIAQVEWRGVPLCLVKPRVAINFSGAALHELFEPSGIDPAQVVLLFDDVQLPLGKTRVRMRGSDGGHLGVRSILEAFQSDQFRRIKLGVQRPGETQQRRDVVLQSFSSAEAAVMSAAVEDACCKLRELVAPA